MKTKLSRVESLIDNELIKCNNISYNIRLLKLLQIRHAVLDKMNLNIKIST